MDMVWHDHGRAQNTLLVVDVSASFEGEVPRKVGETPVLMVAKVMNRALLSF
jgi:hypothetical protein